MVRKILLSAIVSLLCICSMTPAYAASSLSKDAYRGSPAQVSISVDSLGEYGKGQPVTLFVTVTGESVKDHAKSINLSVPLSTGEYKYELQDLLVSNANADDIGSHSASNIKYTDTTGKDVTDPASHLANVDAISWDVGNLNEGERATYAVKIKIPSDYRASSLVMNFTNKYTLASDGTEAQQRVGFTIPVDTSLSADGCTQNGGWHAWVVDESNPKNRAATCTTGGLTYVKCRYCGKTSPDAFDNYPEPIPHSFVRENGTIDSTVEKCSVCSTPNPLYNSNLTTNDVFRLISAKPISTTDFTNGTMSVGDAGYITFQISNNKDFAFRNINLAVELPQELKFAPSSFGQDGSAYGNKEMRGEVINGAGSSLNIASHTLTVNWLDAKAASDSGNNRRMITLYAGYECVASNAEKSTTIKVTVSADDVLPHTFEIKVPLREGSTNPSTCDHDYQFVKTNHEATCVTKGEDLYRCSKCGKEELRSTATIPHNYGADGKSPRCQTCGNANPNLAHSPKWTVSKVIQEGNCFTPRIEEVYCAFEGCPQSGEHATHQNTIPAPGGHTKGEYVVENEKKATCSEQGSYDKVWYCTRCSEEITPRETNVPTARIPHTYKDGVCTVCGMKRSEAGTEHNHVITNWEVVKEPTCTEYGEQRGTCECGYVRTKPIDRIPHLFGIDHKCVYCGFYNAASNPSDPSTRPDPVFNITITPSVESATIGQEFDVTLTLRQIMAGARQGVMHIVVELSEGLVITTKDVQITGLNQSLTQGAVASRGKGFDIMTESFPAESDVTLTFKVKAEDDAIQEESIKALIDSEIDNADCIQEATVAISDGAATREPVDIQPASMRIVPNPQKITSLAPEEKTVITFEVSNEEPASDSGSVRVECTMPDGLTLSTDKPLTDASALITNWPQGRDPDVTVSNKGFTANFDKIEFGLHPLLHLYATSDGTQTGTVEIDFTVTPENGEPKNYKLPVTLVAEASDVPPIGPDEIVDKQSLQLLIDYAASKDPTQYSVQSWNKVLAAVQVAQDVIDDVNATDADIRSAGEALYMALKSLEPKGADEGLSAAFILSLDGDAETVAVGDSVNFSVTVKNNTGADYDSPIIVLCEAEQPLEIIASEINSSSVDSGDVDVEGDIEAASIDLAAEPAAAADESSPDRCVIPSLPSDGEAKFTFTASTDKDLELANDTELGVNVSVLDSSGTELINPLRSTITLLGNAPSSGGDNTGNGDNTGTDGTNSGNNAGNQGGANSNNQGATTIQTANGNAQTLIKQPSTTQSTTTSSPVTSKIASKIPDTGFIPAVAILGTIAGVAVVILIVKTVSGRKKAKED